MAATTLIYPPTPLGTHHRSKSTHSEKSQMRTCNQKGSFIFHLILLLSLIFVVSMLAMAANIGIFRMHVLRRDFHLRLIQWQMTAKDTHPAECQSIQYSVENINCSQKAHWEYIWFQHVRKAGGSSVCQMLIDNGLAAKRAWGDPRNCLLFGSPWKFGVDHDLNSMKCMEFLLPLSLNVPG